MSSFHLRKMLRLDIFLTNLLDFTKTIIIIPLALIASESIAHSVFGLMGYIGLIAHMDLYGLVAHLGSRNNC